jgi:hypothetical protein
MNEVQVRVDETIGPAKAAEGAPKKITPEEFITTSPLYVKVPIDFYPPPQISSIAGTRPVPKKPPVRLGSDISNAPPSPPSMVEVVAQVMKIGQFPEPSVDLPSGLEKNLGEEAAKFYRRALICRNAGFGLGAVTYMRRVVEDKTNELIELAAQYAESYEMDDATIKAIRAAGDSTEYTTYEDKLKYASGVFPLTLMVGSYNPLDTLYGLVSRAIHSLSEDQCIVIADETAAVFDYVFSKLRADVADRAQFVARMKRLSQPKRPKPNISTEP